MRTDIHTVARVPADDAGGHRIAMLRAPAVDQRVGDAESRQLRALVALWLALPVVAVLPIFVVEGLLLV